MLQGVTFKAEATKTTALCGQSGCGKSRVKSRTESFMGCAPDRICDRSVRVTPCDF